MNRISLPDFEGEPPLVWKRQFGKQTFSATKLAYFPNQDVPEKSTILRQSIVDPTPRPPCDQPPVPVDS